MQDTDENIFDVELLGKEATQKMISPEAERPIN